MPLSASLLLAVPALAGTFTVAPTTVSLGAEHHSGLVVLTNTGSDPIRFEVTAESWDEAESGEMLLAPTDDLLVFPSLFTLAPGDSRQVRIGTTREAADLERTWRVFVEELPSLSSDGQVGVQVRTRMGIPVFLSPLEPRSAGRIADASVDDGQLSLRVVDDGTTHFRVQDVALEATAADGHTVLTDDARGWYVLAGGARDFHFSVPPGSCRDIAAFHLVARTDIGDLAEELPADPARCAVE